LLERRRSLGRHRRRRHRRRRRCCCQKKVGRRSPSPALPECCTIPHPFHLARHGRPRIFPSHSFAPKYVSLLFPHPLLLFPPFFSLLRWRVAVVIT
jgi:hypothetical protein